MTNCWNQSIRWTANYHPQLFTHKGRGKELHIFEECVYTGYFLNEKIDTILDHAQTVEQLKSHSRAGRQKCPFLFQIFTCAFRLFVTSKSGR